MRFALAPALVVTLTTGGFAQQTVPRGRGGVPVAPNGIPAVPLPDKPLEFKTAEGQNIRVAVVARGMSNPWSMVWLPDGDMLITQRTGQLRRLRKGVLDPAPVAGVPEVVAGGLGGLMEITLHPQFATNQFVYLSYPKAVGPAPAPPAPGGAGGGRGGGQQSVLAVARGRWDGAAL
jgi:glucose/arabinose dehydrogenase